MAQVESSGPARQTYGGLGTQRDFSGESQKLWASENSACRSEADLPAGIMAEIPLPGPVKCEAYLTGVRD